jgi:hypothetical protein
MKLLTRTHHIGRITEGSNDPVEGLVTVTVKTFPRTCLCTPKSYLIML